jgi:hypothetical protein
MFDRIFGNWKTSLTGIVAGCATWFLQNQPDAGFTWSGFKVALPSVLMGLFLRDSGLSKPQ